MKALTRSLFCGTVLAAAASASPLQAAVAPTTAGDTIYNFGANGQQDGAGPNGSLIVQNGTIYGTTYVGGAYQSGTIFSFNPATNVEKVVYSFQGLSDGAGPKSGLISARGLLYGTTFNGGAPAMGGNIPGSGTVFQFNPKTGQEKVIHPFSTQATDGGSPLAPPIYYNSQLYGTTLAGGTAGGFGTIYQLNPVTKAFQLVYSFAGNTDGAFPEAQLTPANGFLFGTTYSGGNGSCNANQGCGTLYYINPAAGTASYQQFYSFQGGTADGEAPIGALVSINGLLYGTTSSGGGTACGGNGCGTIFSIDPTTTPPKVTIIYDLASMIGANPNGGIAGCVHRGVTPGRPATFKTIASTAFSGGTAGSGTVFELSTNTSTATALYDFLGGATDGGNPTGDLLYTQQNLYGATYQFGLYWSGTIFKVTP